MSPTHTQSRFVPQTSQYSRANSPSPSKHPGRFSSPTDVQDTLSEIAFVLNATRRIKNSILEKTTGAVGQDEPTLPKLPAPMPC